MMTATPTAAVTRETRSAITEAMRATRQVMTRQATRTRQTVKMMTGQATKTTEVTRMIRQATKTAMMTTAAMKMMVMLWFLS